MSKVAASYDQLAHQVQALRKENSHLRRELEDNSNHLFKLENETSDMKEVLKQLQNKLDQEAGTLASSGRTDVLDQLKELHMDLTNYYELKTRPTLPPLTGGEREELLALAPPPSALLRSSNPLRPSSSSRQNTMPDDALLDGAPPTAALIGGDGRMNEQHVEELYREKSLLLSEMEREERERCWYYTELQGLTQRIAQLPHIDTFSIQMDVIRQQLEFEVQQVRSVMEERFGTNDLMVQRTQMRVGRLEQLERELQEARENQELQLCGAETTPGGETENSTSAAAGTEPAADRGSKVEMVFWLLSMMASRDKEEMSRTLLAMSSSQDSCLAMRRCGCVPLLVQILHQGGEAGGCSREARSRASATLHNIIYCQGDEGQARREMRVLHMLEQVRSHCDSGWEWIDSHRADPTPGGTRASDIPEPVDPQICQVTCAVMKLSFEEEYRRAMNELGAVQVVADLLHLDQETYGMLNDPINLALRRYAGMALTNLTFGDVANKATLCSKRSCLQALVAQLESESEELHQVVSSILRNLSWRADISSKRVLRDIGSVPALITCALQATKESTLKSLLSALWNLSAHSVENKVSICSVDGALGFLVSTLTYRCQTNSLAIIESGGGILRNVSSLIATREDYRQILRDHSCLQTLLQHLRSHSLTIVSNACGTLWNLSARSPRDQELLWDLGAVSMLRNLIHSKHKMIAMGSAAALRNLLSNRPFQYKDTAVISPGSCVPSLYMRKQKALEAELDAKHLSETFDTLDKPSPKHLSLNKPLRHMESLAKDYASDSGCFDDDEAPNVTSSLDTGSFSMLSMFLSNSNFLQSQAGKKEHEAEREVDLPHRVDKRPASHDHVVSAAAETLAKKITNTVAKIDRLVDDITMHTSSEDSFSLSSEDPFADWPYGMDELNEARAKSCSPCHLSDTSSLAHRERLSRAHALLRLKAAHTSLSTDSLNSGSTSDGYCGSKDRIAPSANTATMQHKRPSQLDLKVVHREYANHQQYANRQEYATAGPTAMSNPNLLNVPERDSMDDKELRACDASSLDQEPAAHTPTSASTKVSSDVSMASIKLSPSYQHVPLIQSGAKFGVAKTTIHVQAAQATRRQAWVPSVLTGGSLTKIPPIGAARSPSIGPMETVQKYSVENTPICFSRCSSLSSLSSGEGPLDGQSQSDNELESDSSLEIIEVEDGEVVKRTAEDETLEDLSDSQLLVTDSNTYPSKDELKTDPSEIPSKQEKEYSRGESPALLEDRSPSSSSENYIHETPLVMSRCSSLSSLGSFDSPSIASSIQSDPCSEMIDGTISPSDLPDSPGQTMPPSRSKTPCCVEPNTVETQSGGGQWESSLRKFLEIADFKERFNLPPDLDTMIYFTVEKPTENFSCASSLSALPLHEHYIQKDVELKLTPLLQQNDKNPPFTNDDDNTGDQEERSSEATSDDDIEILKECINSAMPSKFRKVRPSLMASIPPHLLNSQSKKQMQLPVYMMLPHSSSQRPSGRRIVMTQKEIQLDDSSFTDSAEGTPVNFSSTTSLSDETLQYPMKEKGAKDWRARDTGNQEVVDDEAKRIDDLRKFSYFHKTNRVNSQPNIQVNQMSKTTKHVIPTQKLLMQSKEVTDRVTNQRNRDQSPNQQRQRQGQVLALPVIQNPDTNQTSRLPSHTKEDIYCYNDQKEREDRFTKRPGRRQTREASRNTLSRSMTNIGRTEQQSEPKGFQRIKQNLMKSESPSCCSLSTSLSSLSDAEFEEHQSKPQQIWTKTRHNKTNLTQLSRPINIHSPYEVQSSPSSVSMDSEDDLLQKCITSAMPKQRRKMAARKKKAEKNQNQKNNAQKFSWNMDQDSDSDDMASDKDSDLNSVEWRAIQEGANSVVTGLMASKSQEPSSEETESVLSFMSTSSFTPKEKKFAKDKKPNKPLDFAQRKPVANLPVVFRGRTVIYTPKKETTLSQRPPPNKVSTKSDAPKNPELAQHRSKSLHRLGRPQEVEWSLPKRSSTPPPRIPKSSSSGSSQSSTPSKHSQKITSPIQINKCVPKKNSTPSSSPPATSLPERRGRSPVLSQEQKSTVHKTQKSPVRIPFMQTSRQPRAISPLVTNQPTNVSRPNSHVTGKRVPPANRLDLVRMTSVHSSGNETDRNGFLRQLTFIKESKTMLRRESTTHSTPPPQGSSRRGRPAAAAVFLCSSRCQELKVAVQGPRRTPGKGPAPKAAQPDPSRLKQSPAATRAGSGEREASARHPPRRTSSESPCRVAQRCGPARGSGARQQQEKDTFKRHASSPSINVLSRVTSRSSVRSSSSDSSGRAKSEDDTKRRGPRCGSRLNHRVTWRRIKDEDVPQILKTTLPATALPLAPSPEEKPKSAAMPAKLPTIILASRKTSDATVQTEDFSSKINSSTSLKAETDAMVSEDASSLSMLRNGGSGSVLQDADLDGSPRGHSTVSTGTTDSFASGGVLFRQGSPSKSARVTPFNYTPSPMTCSTQDPPTPGSQKTGEKREA